MGVCSAGAKEIEVSEEIEESEGTEDTQNHRNHGNQGAKETEETEEKTTLKVCQWGAEQHWESAFGVVNNIKECFPGC